MKSMTISISSYQRCESVVRLVRSLSDAARDAPAVWSGVDVLVCLDGSTDGSQEALRAGPWSLPVEVHWQQNGGAASARNTCLQRAGGDIIWFLDDDLVPAPGTLERHRAAHENGAPRVLAGPCVIPAEVEVPSQIRQWWDDHYAPLVETGEVRRFDQFSVANASAPVELFRDVGGFDTHFTEYGWEDSELGIRVADHGYARCFDAKAIAWHYTTTDGEVAFSRQRSMGRGAVHLFTKHPELMDSYFPNAYPSRLERILDFFRVSHPRAIWLLAMSAYTVMPVGDRFLRRRKGRLRQVAWEMAFLAGIADKDRTLVPRALGRAPAQVAA